MRRAIARLSVAVALTFLAACGDSGSSGGSGGQEGLEVKFVVGSALKTFCQRAAQKLGETAPKLSNGEPFYLTCEAKGSGDVVSEAIAAAKQLRDGVLQPEDPQLPTLLSVDGAIYQSQLIFQMEQLFPGQNYIPQITDSPLLANSPMVFMTTSELANGLRQQQEPYKALLGANTHKNLDPNAPQLPVRFVQTAPTRSNSGLQTLVTQFAAVSGKRPEELTVADVQKYQADVQKIQAKVTRYGASTGTLARDMVRNGPFWASIGSVYESSVIEANVEAAAGGQKYEAVYPKSTFGSNMRAILPNAPWVSAEEKEAAEKTIEFLRSPETQQIATELGLRPGAAGVALGSKFVPQFGVRADATYDSLRPPQPEVVDAMLKSWQEFAKKPSQVALVVDSSGSMLGEKLPAVQSTLRAYAEGLGPKEKIALIDFDSEIRSPVLADGTPAGRDRALQFIASLQANGGTRLYDAILEAQKWVLQNYRNDAINAVVVLTDGEDQGSQNNIDFLAQELQKNGFSEGSDRRIAVFTVGYGSEGEFDPQALQRIATTGSGYYRKGDPGTIANLMADLQVEF